MQRGDNMITYIGPSRVKKAQPKQSDFKMHTHDHYEILLFLSGDADYAVEGNVYRLHSGDMLIMKKSEAHHLVLRSDATYERMVVHFNVDDRAVTAMFDSKPLGKNNLYKAAEVNERWVYYLDRICTHGQDFYLIPLLYELAERGLPESEGTQDRAHRIIEYINEHLEGELTLDELCQKFYVSKTHLNRIFKKTTGTTVWNYITVKRLFLAKKLIADGTRPTDAYEKAGFGDYTAFFKAYKKQFGESPKAQKVKSNA